MPFIDLALKVDDATQQLVAQRREEAGWEHYTLEHGYCRSLYVTDPDADLRQTVRIRT